MSDLSIKSFGQCHCGGIKFQIDGLPPEVIFCHCSTCRKLSGHYVAASSGIRGLKIEGKPNWYSPQEGYQRGFCPDCGAQMFWHDEARDHYSIMAGAFDDASQISAKSHIFLGSKPDYYQIDDDLPKYLENLE